MQQSSDGALTRERQSTRAWYLLLLLPLIGTLFPGVYNRTDPTVIGIPFFYWYLMVWVPVSAVVLVIVYRCTRGEG